jgi:hypothetical protein
MVACAMLPDDAPGRLGRWTHSFALLVSTPNIPIVARRRQRAALIRRRRSRIGCEAVFASQRFVRAAKIKMAPLDFTPLEISSVHGGNAHHQHQRHQHAERHPAGEGIIVRAQDVRSGCSVKGLKCAAQPNSTPATATMVQNRGPTLPFADR